MVHWIDFLRLWCWLTMGIITGMYIQKNRQFGILRFKRMKARLIREGE